jgi:hypothetical protein
VETITARIANWRRAGGEAEPEEGPA